MCGIAGFIGKGGEGLGHKMIQTISYRGPDFQKVFLRDNVCLTHARLRILDLSEASNQPMLNADNSIALTFNGEIYNYQELKNELLALNKYEFKTTSDTEVLLYAYQEFGEKFLDQISGMFVFAIYDFRNNKLLIARDRMGKKPIYYCHSGSSFIFGSEVKALLVHPEVSSELNYDAINQYLTFDYIPTPNSLYKSISKLAPAHYLILDNNKIEIKPFWQPDYKTDSNIDFSAAKSKLDELLNHATKIRLMSDVPLGVFLSGGLDSSAVAYYAQKNTNQRIKTYSIGFEDKSYDEKDYAQLVSKHLDTEHYESILTPKMTLGLIDEVFSKLDEPFADASILPTYYLSKFTREHVTVALGGDGSDELLAGYPTFISEEFRHFIQYLPNFLPRQILKISSLILSPSDNNISLDFKIKQFLRGFESQVNHIHQLWLGGFTPFEKKDILRPEIFQSLTDNAGMRIIDSHFSSAKNYNADAWHSIIHYYCQTYLVDDILFKVDRASMYNSLEVRAPFLDRAVVEFLNSLPKSMKYKNLQGKHILKEVMRGKIPSAIIDRPKKGFGIPLSKWIREDLKNEIESVVLAKDHIFEHQKLEKLVWEHQSGKANHRKLIWNLYCLKKILK
ncbi:MAG: asparagine synthase (glutamine-hydrolyzing) [Chitinophagales bacterium]|nr:asparagine synthase (glutamine-hydrolyzing) [Chitinophagales bacterium]